MNLSQVKLVVTDMDGTLLNSKHEVSPLFFELFRKLKALNIVFAAASGRPYYGITKKLNTIKNDIIIIAENGGLAAKEDITFISNPIKHDNLQKIIVEIGKIDNVHPVFCSKDKAFVMSKSQPLMNLLSEYYANYSIIDTPEDIDSAIYKVALYHEESSEKYVYPYIKHLEAHFKVKLSATHWVDISENIANKGHAVKHIQDKFNIKEEETLVFGDYSNDLEMLEKAYFSYAMENAHQAVKSAARFKTESNNNYGVELILQKLLQEKDNSRE